MPAASGRLLRVVACCGLLAGGRPAGRERPSGFFRHFTYTAAVDVVALMFSRSRCGSPISRVVFASAQELERPLHLRGGQRLDDQHPDLLSPGYLWMAV